MNRLRRIRHDQSGMSYVFIGMGMMAFLSASMLAIDVGMLMTSRSQAQNSADAGALAGATALVFNNYNDRTPAGPAVTEARTRPPGEQGHGHRRVGPAQRRHVPAQIRHRTVNRVKVDVFRTAARGNPVSTLIAKFFGMNTADIGATATAEASPANAMTCVKPFTIPDKWIEKQTPAWDMGRHLRRSTPTRASRWPNPDIYIPADQAGIHRLQRMIANAGSC